MPSRGLIPESDRWVDGAENTSMLSGCPVSAGPRILLLDLPGGKYLFVLDNDRSDLILAILICPNFGKNVINRVNDVAITVVADHSVGTLGAMF